MKYVKRIIKATVFLAGLVVLLIISSQILMPKNNLGSSGMENVDANGFLAEKENSLDVLFLGDSESFCSFIPMQIWNETGITSYNCSNAWQELSYSYTLLKRACKTQSPKVVFLETDAICRPLSAQSILYETMSELFPVFRYHNRWKNMFKCDLTSSPDYTGKQLGKGYIYHNYLVPVSKFDPSISMPTDERIHISRWNVMYVEAIKSYCDSIGAKLVLVSVPSTVNWNYSRHNSLVSLSEKLECDYIDLNLLADEIKIEWDLDTLDAGDHLNYRGACKVTTYLSKYLSTTGLFKSHKGDPEYAQWEEDYQEFNAMVNNGKTY